MSWSASGGDQNRARFIENSPRIVVVRERPGEQAARHALPKLAQALNSSFGWVSSDDGAVDSTDRRAGDPGRGLAGFAQGLVGASLVGAECSAALEDKNDLFLGIGHAVPLQAD
jgi:hypothetical protein